MKFLSFAVVMAAVTPEFTGALSTKDGATVVGSGWPRTPLEKLTTSQMKIH